MTIHDQHMILAVVIWMIFGIYCGVRMILKLGEFCVKDLRWLPVFALLGTLFWFCLLYDFFKDSRFLNIVLIRSDAERREDRYQRKVEEAQQANEQARIERELGLSRQSDGLRPIERKPPKRP